MVTKARTTLDNELDGFDEQVRAWEDSVLGGAIAFPEKIPQMLENNIAAGDFQRPSYGKMFRLLADRSRKGEPIGNAYQLFRTAGLADDDHDRAWFSQLTQRADPTQAVMDAGMLRRAARLRRIQKAFIEGLTNAAYAFADPDEILEALAELKENRRGRLAVKVASELHAERLTLREPIIHGALRRGETANIIAPPKFGKSWLVLALAISVARGEPWLGLPTAQERVLIVDNELHEETLINRVGWVCHKMGCAVPDNLHLLELRGQAFDIEKLAVELHAMEGQYGLIVLDALYRFLPKGVSENDNAEMMGVYNTIDRIAKGTGAAIAVIHHSSKGDQSGKEAMDVGAGAGAIGRAADTHLVLRSHELDGCAVLDINARSWPPLEQSTIQFEFPLWIAKNIEPALKQRKTNSETRQAKLDNEADNLLRRQLTADKWLSVRQLRRLTGLGEVRADRAIARFMESGEAISKTVKRHGKRTEVYQLGGPESGPREKTRVGPVVHAPLLEGADHTDHTWDPNALLGGGK